MIADIVRRRLANQRISSAPLRSPSGVVSWFGAVQAQEYEHATWGVGLRMPAGTVAADVEHAFDTGAILRTHVMRPTWHFVAADDIAWMQALTAPRVHRVMSSYNRQLELDGKTMARGTRVIERALRDHQYLTRQELGERLGRSGLVAAGTRLAQLAMHAELEGVICSGPRRGKQSTYALVGERAPRARRLPREDAIGELARRFLRSHGPATIRDFVWWSGLLTADAARGIEMSSPRREQIGGLTYFSLGSPRPPAPDRAHRVHLLPIYDEYVVAYRDREAVPHGPPVERPRVIFQHALAIDGQIAGTWRTAGKKTKNRTSASVDVTALRPLANREQRDVAAALDRYTRFRSSAAGR